jgi:hypothetical protein
MSAPKLRLIRKSTQQKHVDACAKYLVDNDLAWFCEAQEYLSLYWENHNMVVFFADYREFLEDVSYTMNSILVGQKTAPNCELHVVKVRKAR